MRLLKSKAFGRFAGSNDITDSDLWDAVERAEKGLIDADLGGKVIKQRIARDGAGKSGGFRSIIFYKEGKTAVFVHGFEKSAVANINTKELKTFKDSAKAVFKLSDKELATAIKQGAFIEVPKPAPVQKEVGGGEKKNV
jgi:hypothetical protein